MGSRWQADTPEGAAGELAPRDRRGERPPAAYTGSSPGRDERFAIDEAKRFCLYTQAPNVRLVDAALPMLAVVPFPVEARILAGVASNTGLSGGTTPVLARFPGWPLRIYAQLAVINAARPRSTNATGCCRAVRCVAIGLLPRKLLHTYLIKL